MGPSPPPPPMPADPWKKAVASRTSCGTETAGSTKGFFVDTASPSFGCAEESSVIGVLSCLLKSLFSSPSSGNGAWSVKVAQKKLSSARTFLVYEAGATDSYFFDPFYFGSQRIYNCRFYFNLKMHFLRPAAPPA